MTTPSHSNPPTGSSLAATLAPAARRREIARLLATAALRCRPPPAAVAALAGKPGKSSRSDLASGPAVGTPVTVREDLTSTQEDRT